MNFQICTPFSSILVGSMLARPLAILPMKN